MNMNLNHEVDKLKDDLIEAVQGCIKFPSVESSPRPGAPFGQDIKECLDWTLALGEKLGFTVKNVDGYAGHIEMGAGPLLGILGHLDVVPEGDGWSVPPYAGLIKEGKIYGRGATDDKGPSLAALFAMKAVQNANVPLNKKVRLILGTDEESGWKDMERYFQTEELPETGFSPDAEFPLIHAEKGILQLALTRSISYFPHLKEIKGGERANVVPDQCKIALNHLSVSEVEERLKSYKFPEGISWEIYAQAENEVFLTFKGISAHGSLPQNGLNAVLYALKFLHSLPLSADEHEFIAWILENPGTSFKGEGMGIALSDQPSGDLSLNLGILELEGQTLRVVLDIRYPVTYSEQDVLPVVTDKAGTAGYTIEILSHQAAHHVPKDSSLVQTLLKAYQEVTGQEGEAFAIGGGTYAKVLPQGVAFGPTFPGEPEVIHCPDEYIPIDRLVLMTKIYAHAIYNLLVD